MNIFKKCSEDGWLISQIAENVSEIELELLLSVYPEAMIQVSPFREIERATSFMAETLLQAITFLKAWENWTGKAILPRSGIDETLVLLCY